VSFFSHNNQLQWTIATEPGRFYEHNECMRLEMSFDYEKYEMDCKKSVSQNCLCIVEL
jgi:hypothetical protein